MEKEVKEFEVHKGKIRRQVSLRKNKRAYINLLSVYDMLVCEKMAQTLTLKLINDGFEREKAAPVAENACLCVMSLTDYSFNPIFNNTNELMTTLTPEDMLTVAREYSALRRDYVGFDVLGSLEIEQLKKN